MKTIRTGSANCWAHWIQGIVVEVGTSIETNNPIRQDMYVWLTTEGVACGTNSAGTALVGFEACKISKTIDCNASKLARLGIGAGNDSICVPSFQWEARK
jgi:hypothetical protein